MASALAPSARRAPSSYGSIATSLALALALAIVPYMLLIDTARGLESHAAAALLRFFGAARTQVQLSNSVAVFPTGRSAFRAEVTPSCSALPSVLAMTCLSLVLPRVAPLSRRVMAVTTACAVIIIGNLLRITTSLAVGFVSGRAALVLFHDWIGNAFGVCYTIGGFLWMLYLLLPSSGDEPPSGPGNSTAAVESGGESWADRSW